MEKGIPAGILKKTILYYYLIAYCPPENVLDLKKNLKTYRTALAKEAGLKMTDYFRKAAPEVSHHIMSFHQNTREPDKDWVEELTNRVLEADKSKAKAEAFHELMKLISRLPHRAKPKNRLHYRKGCKFCAAPCGYGYFTLLSEPDFVILNSFLENELILSTNDQKPILAVTSFTLTHIALRLGISSGSLYISPDHLANLGYCLVTLAIAKSRIKFPEEQVKLFQDTNQYIVQNRLSI